LLVFLLLGSVAHGDEASIRLFRDEVRPLLLSHCLECHGEGKAGGLDLRTHHAALAGGDSGPALAPKDAEASLLYQKVAAGEMPPQQPLEPEQMAMLKRWIDGGAPYAGEPLDPFAHSTDRRAGYDWWSFQPLARDLP